MQIHFRESLFVVVILCAMSLAGGQTMHCRCAAVPAEADFLGIAKKTDSYVFAVGRKGTILQSIDGGRTWTKLKSGTDATLRRLKFFNDNLGWAVGDGGSYPKLSEKQWEEKKGAHILLDGPCPASLVVT